MQKYSWEDLPAAYRDAPYFTLDPQCAIYSDETPTADANLDIATIDEIKEEETDTSTPMPICEMNALPLPPTYARRSLGATCTDKLDQLKGLTFNIRELTISLRTRLRRLIDHKKVICACPKGNLPL
eukprot:gene5788-11077_t